MRNIQKAILVVCLSATISAGKTQNVTQFKLADYKYRTPQFSSLQLDLDLSQSSNSHRDQSVNFKNTAIRGGFTGLIDYLLVYSTDARQHIRTFHGAAQPEFASINQNGIKTADNSWHFGTGYRVSDRRYKGNRFLETGGSVVVNTGMDKNGTKDQHTRYSSSDIWADLHVGVGKGRLEYVHDAQTALFILNDLYRAGIIKNRVDNETANGFAQLVTNMKKRRVLDARERMIFQLTQVDSFLRVSGILPHCDAKAMAIINDNLFYAFQNDLTGNPYSFGEEVNFDLTRGLYDEGYTDYGLIPELEPISDQVFRQHGTIIYARLIPKLRYSNNKTKMRSNGKDSIYKFDRLLIEPVLRLGIEKHEAIDLQRQKTYGATLEIGYRTGPNSSMFLVGNGESVNLSGMYGLGYYPNSRTVVEGSAELQLGYSKSHNSKTFLINPELKFSTGYFISYNTVLRAEAGISYQKFTGDEKTNYFTQQLRIYLRHYFF